MITSVNFCISGERSDDEIREIVGKLCDVITDEGLASTGNPEDGIVTVAVVKVYDTEGIDNPEFLDELFEGSLFAVMPISKGEENGD